VSARLAEAMGGGMMADSRLEHGTRFAVVLPDSGPESQQQAVEGVA